MKNIAITGGGTGGHLVIAKALKEELNKRGLRPIYIGSNSGQDKKWFKDEQGLRKCYFLASKGVVDKKGIKRLSVLFEIVKMAFTCRKILKEEKIDAVFCVGGYSAAPASFASLLSFTPLYIHEQNAVLGSLNKVLKPFAKEFFSSYENNSKVKDYPIREDFFLKRRIRNQLKTVIFLGGSQGARAINNLAMNLAKTLLDKGLCVIHQTGINDFERIKTFYEQNNLQVECFDFSSDLLSKITQADFAISRAGASTLWELCANNLPTLFIPYPYAAKDHQYFNAKALSTKNAAFLMREEEIREENLLKILNDIDLEQVSKTLQGMIKPNGISQIADIIFKDAK
jgi:UDP-N-acetylglucosamine--N-acetylmuramyl-(pentapeptide) pyrophosphoryl-undecaprenol N-acetylglucosamine transferase